MAMRHKGSLDVTKDVTVSGALQVSGLNYPTSDGTVNQVIETDGAGTLSFVTVSGGGSGVDSIAGLLGIVTVSGKGEVGVTVEGQAIVVSGTDHSASSSAGDIKLLAETFAL